MQMFQMSIIATSKNLLKPPFPLLLRENGKTHLFVHSVIFNIAQDKMCENWSVSTIMLKLAGSRGNCFFCSNHSNHMDTFFSGAIIVIIWKAAFTLS